MTIDAQDVTKSDGIDRRTIVKAAAWAAPVIAIAAATPAYAASPGSPEPVPSTTTNTAFSATSVEDVEVGGSRTGIQLNQYPDDGWVYFTVRDNGVTVPAGTYYVDASLTYTVVWTSSQELEVVDNELRGWIRTTTGATSVLYTYTGRVLNGAANQVALPNLTIAPVGGGAMSGGQLTANVAGPNIPVKGVNAGW